MRPRQANRAEGGLQRPEELPASAHTIATGGAERLERSERSLRQRPARRRCDEAAAMGAGVSENGP
jgi:hypothetical protein